MLQILKKLKEKEIKRQEHIYEFVLTEKHHCLTLIVMQKVNIQNAIEIELILWRMTFFMCYLVP